MYTIGASKFIELFHSFERTEIKKIVVHSFDTAKASVAILKRLNSNDNLCEMYLAGLAHDVGLVLYGSVKNIERFKSLVGELKVSDQGVISFDIDQLIETVDRRNEHAVVSWKMIEGILSKKFAEAVLHHHSPWKASDEETSRLAYVIHIADVISNVYRRESMKSEAEAMAQLLKVLESMNVPYRDIKSAAMDLLEDLVDFSMVVDTKPHVDYFTNVKRIFKIDEILRIFKIFVYLVDFRSPFTRNHSSSIATLARDVASEMMKSSFDSMVMYIAGLIHDFGKLGTPLSILHKPGGLSKCEGMVMKRHVADTFRITRHMSEISEILNVAVMHHERLDGSGYPYGLKAPDIPMKARILQVCDVFVALTENRPYRRGMDYDSALKIIERDVRNGKLDPDVFETLKNMVENGYRLSEEKTVIDEIFDPQSTNRLTNL